VTLPDSFRVRPARAEDEAAIGELLIRAFNETYARKMPGVTMTERRRAELRAVPRERDRAWVLAAEIDGRLVGTVTLYPPGFAGGHAWLADCAELRFLAIAPEWQGHGLAEPLMKACHQQAVAWGCRSICLHVRRGAEGVARFYQRHGYRLAPEGDLDLLPEVYLEAYLRTVG